MIPKKTVFFIILCVFVVSSKFSSKTIQQKIEEIILFDGKSLVNTSFLYGLCHNTNENNSTCKIVLQYIDLDINKPNKEISCPVDITTDINLNSNTRITVYKIVRIGEDKAVVLLTEEEIHEQPQPKPEDNEIDPDYDYPPSFYDSADYGSGPESNKEQEENTSMQNIKELRAVNIDLINCQTNTNKISLPISLTKNTAVSVLPFKDTYDIVITEKLLNTTNVYKGTYSLQGTTIMNSSAWGLRYPDNRIIAFGNVKLHSSDGGYLTINSIMDSEQQSIIRITATLINQGVKSLKLGYANVKETYDVIYSTSHDMIGICVILRKNRANCSFFDMEGLKLQETSVKLDGAYILNMHNLPNGFLLFTEECFDCDKFPLPAFHPGNFQYAVTRFDFTSKEIIKTSLPESIWLKSLHSWTYFFENEAEEICVTFLSLKNIPPFVPYFHQNDTLEVIIKCFLDL